MSTLQDLPTLDQLLIDGGDARLILQADGTNKYGCAAVPLNAHDAMYAFSSATASSISAPAYAAATRTYTRLQQSEQDAYACYANELNEVRQELKQLCGLEQRKDVDIIFAASGTDLHLIAAQLCTNFSSARTLVIMADANETGSAVPSALTARHFSERTALGEQVNAGSHIAQAKEVDIVSISLRQPDGTVRDSQDVDREVEALTQQAIHCGQAVMLILMDVSKTGMMAPSLSIVIQLRARYPQLQVMVDACQFRLSNASLQAYLDQGYMVAMTGSKFLCGPSFSGALFLPHTMQAGFKAISLPASLNAYSSRADWPSDWAGAQGLPARPNCGLLLRWVAALEELRAFRALPDAAILGFIQQFQLAVYDYFSSHSSLALLTVAAPDRSAIMTGQGWDCYATIFSFVLMSTATSISGKAQPYSHDDTVAIYRHLQKEKGMQLGQPVTCGIHHGKPISALRLCLGARQIVAAVQKNQASTIIAAALQVLDEVQRQMLRQ
ncbi:hypothetical protein H8L32_22880 [Undibacterium sp. CY18W]|uniref:Selenocysteine lyase/cysteine desulfurase n=1 Tax=Undibacterium hunanense TaxID=2762292 RepID=A0ABR6ZWT0_9BURK|nr:hypothetical protein [Undibacterium hunanense]MBC3920327.1 hypothetical protein [Undibacterium hunanense]